MKGIRSMIKSSRPSDQGIVFGDRILVLGFSDLPKMDHDSSEYIFEDRQRP